MAARMRRPSISSRISFAISTHSAEAAAPVPDWPSAQAHIEEIEEIRRYEVRRPLLLGTARVRLD